MISPAHRALTAKQTIFVLLILTLLGGAVFLAYREVTAWRHRIRVEKAIPNVLTAIRSQLEDLKTAIEAYRGHFGYYPRPGNGGPVTNTLFYELVGTRFRATDGTYNLPTTKDPIPGAELERLFKIHSFSNTLPMPTWPTNFLFERQIASVGINGGDEVFGIGYRDDDGLLEEMFGDFKISAWRYTQPGTHNPGGFDIWIEVEAAGKHYTLGNWPEVN
jgi:hypothetical protein